MKYHKRTENITKKIVIKSQSPQLKVKPQNSTIIYKSPLQRNDKSSEKLIENEFRSYLDHNESRSIHSNQDQEASRLLNLKQKNDDSVSKGSISDNSNLSSNSNKELLKRKSMKEQEASKHITTIKNTSLKIRGEINSTNKSSPEHMSKLPVRNPYHKSTKSIIRNIQMSRQTPSELMFLEKYKQTLMKSEDEDFTEEMFLKVKVDEMITCFFMLLSNSINL